MRNYAATIPDFRAFPSNPGDSVRIVYKMKIDKSGHRYLDPVDKINVQDYINSFESSTDLSFMLSRLQHGDTSVLNSGVPSYGDFTQFPKTYAEALDLVTRSEDAFRSMPVDIRNSFNNDLGEWFAEIGSDSWMKKMSPLLSHDKPVPNENTVAVIEKEVS